MSVSLVIDIDERAQDCADVPLAATSDKLHEAMYFYYKMLETYHEPEVFRYNLNAFIQSQRSVLDVLPSNLSLMKAPNWRQWFKKAETRIQANTLLSKFHHARNFVVHQGMLQTKSRAFIGVMRYRKPKLGFELEVNPLDDSRELLRRLTPSLGLIPDSHPFVGEEYGVERSWTVEDLGPAEVTEYCRNSFSVTECLTRQAVGLAGGWLGGHALSSASEVRILTESMADPSLIEKWGW